MASLKPKNRIKRILQELYKYELISGKFCSQILTERDWLLYKKVDCGQFPGNRKDISRFLDHKVIQRIDGQPIKKWLALVTAQGGFNRKTALMKADLWTYLSENCLMKTDRASMAWGLEVRVPFLANAVLDFALKMPESIHFSCNKGKQLLHKLAELHLPENVWNRKKHGFSIPLNEYFREDWKNLAEELFYNSSDYFPILNSKSITKMWEEYRQGKKTHRTIYTVLVLLIWAKNNRTRIIF